MNVPNNKIRRSEPAEEAEEAWPSGQGQSSDQQAAGNETTSVQSTAAPGQMSPRPYDDGLFIEPAGDYDVVYGDYNATMADGTPSGKRPYLRLTGALRNMSRPVGTQVRMRCEAAGSPMPIQFTWLKNLAPVEKNRRTRIRHRELSSKLVIQELDVLDSGYYQCTATNAAGSVNSTAVLRVSHSAPSSSSPYKKRPAVPGESRHHRVHHQQQQQQEELQQEDYDGFYDNYPDEDGGIMKPGQQSADGGGGGADIWRVPSSAAGPGYVPLRRAGGAGGPAAESDGRWLDGQQPVRKGDCIPYRGEACAQSLGGKHVKVLVDREHIYDSEKDLLAALMTVRVMPGVSEQCRQLSHQVACYHMFKVCDPSVSSIAAMASASGTDIISLCREDCDSLKSSVCPNEFAMAAQHDLVGDNPKALLPNCEALMPGAQRCLSVLDKPKPAADGPSSSSNHWCFVGSGTKYQGSASSTRSNRPCIYWPSSANSEFNTDSHPQLRHAKNHCRNPATPTKPSQFREPWCYTVSPGSQSLLAEPCNVPRCPPNLYPELDDSLGASDSGGSASSSPLDSLSALWQSLSAQSQLLALASALGSLALLLFLLALCCVYCHRRKDGGGGGRRRKGLRTAGGGDLMGRAQQQQQESASSMLSGSVVQQKMALLGGGGQPNNSNSYPAHHQQQQQMLVQSCNGGGGGSSTLGGGSSDLNSAFYRKVRDERMRAAAVAMGGGGGGADELLNPLLPYGGGALDMQQMVQQHPGAMAYDQQHHQQMVAQSYCWPAVGGAPPGSGGTLNSGSMAAVSASYPVYYGGGPQSAAVGGGPASQQSQLYSSPHASTEPPPAEPYQIAHIQEEQIKFTDRRIGEDQSTRLVLGEWAGGMISGATLQVALKTLRPNMPHIAAEQFREEIQAVGFFEHPNVIRLFGVTFLNGRDLCAVFDYMVHGDLVEFLKVREPRGGAENDEQERQRNAEDFLHIGTQITAGMAYLAANGHVHRDIAARNCLVGDQQVIKVANFARLRPQYERDYYKLNANCRGVPLRWMAKEALNEGRFSQASDVYAFGVCLWEIYTYARQPFEGFSDEQVIRLVQEDNYPDMPECPPAVYALMVECFNANPGRRPSFGELHNKFQKWCQSGQPSALHVQQHRASSVHSGGSSSGLLNGGGAAAPLGKHTRARQSNHQLQQQQGNSLVPSPAPNANNTILAGNLGQGKAQLAKLAMLSNGGASIVHSTPLAQHQQSADQQQQQKGATRPVPLARRRTQRAAYTSCEDELDEEEEEYSSGESRDS